MSVLAALRRHLPLAAVLGGALALRATGLDWDQGHLFHPDERAIVMKVGELGLPWPPDPSRLLDPATSPLNPRWFPYGSFPLYLLKVAGFLASQVNPALATYPDLRLVGRALSVAFDLGTVLLVFLVGARLYRPGVGLLAAGLAAVTVLHIQLSHFFTVDVLLTFCVMLALYGGALTLSGPSPRSVLFTGIGLGLGLATKVSIAPLVLVVAAAHLLWACQDDHGQLALGNLWTQGRLGRAAGSLALAVALAAMLFVVTQPFALQDRTAFLRDLREQSEMVLRVRDYPYTRQYVGTPAYLYPVWQLSVWGLGLPLALAAWAGLLAALRRGLWERRAADLLLLSWVVPYFLLTGAFPVKFLRYLLPIVPVLLVLAARLLLARTEEKGARAEKPLLTRRWRNLLLVPSVLSPQSSVLALVLVATAAYALAYVQIYARPHPAVAAAAWVREHVPPGALLLREHWEESLPGLVAYPQRELTLYEPDDGRKLAHLTDVLRQGQYLVLFSNRLYGTIPRLPERYPLSTRYYQALFRGELGYQLVYAAASYPSLMGVSLVDDTFSRPELPVPELLRGFRPTPVALNLGYADESFTVYDHPLVLVFQKVEPRSPEQLAAALTPSLPVASPAPAGSRLLLSDEDWAAQQAGGTWRHLFSPDGLANRLPALFWLLVVQGLGLLAVPGTLLLFRPLPDRGYPFARALGLLLVSYLAWLGASLKLLPYTWPSIVLIVGLVGLGAALLARRYALELKAVVAARWRLLALEEALFVGAFVVFYGLRLLNPDLWHPWRGGEKPMDFAYLNAVIKSTWMPPYDPWFAGGSINYYYFGYVLVATLTKLTGILPEVAFNLAVPLFFALLVSGVFSVVYNLAESARRALAATSSAGPEPVAGRAGPARWFDWLTRSGPSSAGPLLAASAGVLMVAVLGNLDGLVQLLEGSRRAAPWRLESNLPGVSGFSEAAAGAVTVLAGGASLPPFDYWRSSRMIPPTIAITEFPFFTFLFADLHAHLLALPYTVLALALALNLALGLARRWQADLAALVALGWVLGALRWTNSWDFPTYFLVGAGSILIGETVRRFPPGGAGFQPILITMPFGKARNWPSPTPNPLPLPNLGEGGGVEPREAGVGEGRRAGLVAVNTAFAERLGMLATAGLKVGLVYLVSTALWYPFSRSYELFYAGITLSPETTSPGRYLLIHGLVLWILGAFLVVEALAALGGLGLLRSLRLGARYWFHLPHARSLLARGRKAAPGGAASILAGAGLVGVLLAVFGQPLASALLILLALTGLLALRALEKPEPGMPQRVFALALLALAVAIGVGVEVVTLQGDIGRMNTVFKFYLQAWVLYGVAAAFALWWLLAKHWERGGGFETRPHKAAQHRLGSFLRPWQAPFLAVLALLFVGSAIYPLAATPVRLRDRFQRLPPTPNGLAYLEAAVYADEHGPLTLRWDGQAIQWLRANVDGSPVILEGVTPIYRWGGRVSILTGLPTVIGWDWHQRQQRWAYQGMVDERLQDVKTLYGSPQPAGALDILRTYGVKYVYVGELERRYYPAAGIAKFDHLVGRGLAVAYRNPAVTIYAVDVAATGQNAPAP